MISTRCGEYEQPATLAGFGKRSLALQFQFMGFNVVQQCTGAWPPAKHYHKRIHMVLAIVLRNRCYAAGRLQM